MMHCRTHAGRIADRIAGATAGHTARTNFNLSTGRLAGGKVAGKNFDLSTGQLSEEFRWELVIVSAEWLHGG